MIRIIAIGAIGALTAMGAATAVASLGAGQPVAASALRVDPAVQLGAPAPARQAQIVKSADGHYWAEANVDGKAVRFLVDTGATAVALTAADATRLGYDVHNLDYRYDVITAEGRVKAAGVKLTSVSVAGARVENVEALVIQRGLDTSLLGMSYLGKLQAFEATRTSMILKP